MTVHKSILPKMGSALSQKKLAEQEVQWGYLPDVALERVFANMEVTTLLRVLETTEDERILHIATSNTIWKKRYHDLVFQEDVSTMLELTHKRPWEDSWDPTVQWGYYQRTGAGKSGMNNFMTYVCYKAWGMLWTTREEGRFPGNDGAYPQFYFIQFLLIWSTFPHVWSLDEGATWSDFQYWVLVIASQTQTEVQYRVPHPKEIEKPDFDWRSVKMLPRCTWIDIKSTGALNFKRYAMPLCVTVHDNLNPERNKEYGNCKNPYIPTVNLDVTLVSRPDNLGLSGGTFDSRDHIPYLVIGTLKEEGTDQISFQAIGGCVPALQDNDDLDGARAHDFAPGNWNDTFGKHRYLGPFDKLVANFLTPWVHIVQEVPYNFDLMGCAVCKIPTAQVCGACLAVAYCSQDCQRADFFGANHRQVCGGKK